MTTPADRTLRLRRLAAGEIDLAREGLGQGTVQVATAGTGDVVIVVDGAPLPGAEIAVPVPPGSVLRGADGTVHSPGDDGCVLAPLTAGTRYRLAPNPPQHPQGAL